MSKKTILVPRKVEGKEFFTYTIAQALKNCQSEGYEAQFIPSIIDTRIEAPKDSEIWQSWYSSPSISATGRTNTGEEVVVYAHTPNYFSNPDNIERAIKQGLIKGAGKLPKDEFQRLVDLDESTDNQGNRLVWVIDYKTLRNSKSDVIPIKDALEHPQTIPFVGGKERAQKYLKRHKEVYGNNIGIWHSDDLSYEPLVRLLTIGDDYCYNGLVGCDYFLHVGCLLGVSTEGRSF